jgi:hypothetical protein
MKSLYTINSTDAFISKLCRQGYEAIQLNEGSLGIGDWVLIAPDEKHYNFVIREVYLNEWSSAQTIRRCAKLSQRILKEIEEAENDY